MHRTDRRNMISVLPVAVLLLVWRRDFWSCSILQNCDCVWWLIQAKRVAVGMLLIICIPHIHCLIYSRAQLNIWWVCWEDPNSMTARILGAVVEFTVGCVVIVVVFVLNLVQTSFSKVFFLSFISTSWPCSILIPISMFSKAVFHSLFLTFSDLRLRPSRPSSTFRFPSSLRSTFCPFNPSFILCVLNLVLSFHIYRNQIPSAPSSQCNLTAYKRQTHNRRLTRTLLVVAVVFLVCETPRMLTSLLLKLIEKTPTRRIVLNAAFALSGVNHAANFFIYIVLSPRFRQLLVERLQPVTDAVARRLGQRQRQNNLCCRRCTGRVDQESRDVTVQFSLQVFDGATAYPDF